MNDEYTDLQIRILSKVEDENDDENISTYLVDAEVNRKAQFRGKMKLDEQELLASSFDPDKYGRALAKALFADDIISAFYQAIGIALSSTESRIRIRLRIDEGVSDLHAIPWERIYHPGQNIALTTSAQTPFSRYLALPAKEGDTLARGPVKLLFVIANPHNLPEGLKPIKVEEELRNLREIVYELKNDDIQIAVMSGRTTINSRLKSDMKSDGIEVFEGHTTQDNLIREMGKYHVVHFLGHGAFRKGTAVLFLEDQDGGAKIVKDDALYRNVAALYPRPHLIFLAACESASRMKNGGSDHPFIGLGPKLVEAGVPAVVAMQERVAMDLAQKLTSDFYRELLEHGRVDVSLNRARNLLFSKDKVDWSIPVLFMRLEDGLLFAIKKDPVLVPAPKPAPKPAPDPVPDRELDPAPIVRIIVPPDQVDIVKLHGEMVDGFNTADLKQLSFTLGVEYEDLGSSTKSGKARDLIQHLQRRGRLQDLLDKLTADRPNVNWYAMTK